MSKLNRLVSSTILLMEEILHQVVDSLSHYLQGFIHPKLCRSSSINSIIISHIRCGTIHNSISFTSFRLTQPTVTPEDLKFFRSSAVPLTELSRQVRNVAEGLGAEGLGWVSWLINHWFPLVRPY